MDRAFERSRATLLRDLRGFLARFAVLGGEGATVGAAVSRASLEVQALVMMVDSRANLAPLSRVSLGDDEAT